MWSRNRKKFTEKQLSSLHKESQQTVISHKSVGSGRSDSAWKTGSYRVMTGFPSASNKGVNPPAYPDWTKR